MGEGEVGDRQGHLLGVERAMKPPSSLQLEMWEHGKPLPQEWGGLLGPPDTTVTWIWQGSSLSLLLKGKCCVCEMLEECAENKFPQKLPVD